MTKNNIIHLEGLIAAPFTPMHENGSLHLELIPGYFEMLKSMGIKGAFICGSTGEGVSMSISEKMMVAKAWASASGNDAEFKVMTLLGGTCIKDCIDLARHAEHIGLYGVSFTAPFYFKPADVKQLAACCKMIADEVSGMPFYYYHIPVLTGANFPMIELLEAVDETIPNFAGVKYTHEDFMDFLSCMHYKNGRYDMLWGRDENMLPALSVGAKAAVGSTFNYAAKLYHQIINAFHSGDLPEAQRLQQKSIDMIRLLGKYGGIATGKSFMKAIGLNCGEFRLPVKNMTQHAFEDFISDLELLDFRSFCSALPAHMNA